MVCSGDQIVKRFFFGMVIFLVLIFGFLMNPQLSSAENVSIFLDATIEEFAAPPDCVGFFVTFSLINDDDITLNEDCDYSLHINGRAIAPEFVRTTFVDEEWFGIPFLPNRDELESLTSTVAIGALAFVHDYFIIKCDDLEDDNTVLVGGYDTDEIEIEVWVENGDGLRVPPAGKLWYIRCPPLDTAGLIDQTPVWIATTAGLWTNRTVSDGKFFETIEFLLESEIIKSDRIILIDNKSEIKSDSKKFSVPDWFRNNAKWFSEGSIGKSDFVNSIQWLIENKIITSSQIAIIDEQP